VTAPENYAPRWRAHLASESGSPTRSASTADVVVPAVAAIAAPESLALQAPGQPTYADWLTVLARLVEVEKHVRTLRSEAA
jgi:hypothetical protein